MANTLAGILAGQQGNPWSQPQGISPLLAQYLQAQFLQGQGQGQQQGGVPQQINGMPPQTQQATNPMALGGLGMATGAY